MMNAVAHPARPTAQITSRPAVAALMGLARPDWRNRQIMRAALHAGAVARLVGARRIELYGTAHVASGPGRPDRLEEQ